MCKDLAVVLCIWAKTVSCLCSVCDCNVYKLIRKSKSIDLLRCTDVYICKNWVMSLQWLCECCILVAAYAQRRAVVLCIWAKTVSCLRNVCICNACKSLRKSKNWLIYCIALMCICAKAESCLHNDCVNCYKRIKIEQDWSFNQFAMHVSKYFA